MDDEAGNTAEAISGLHQPAALLLHLIRLLQQLELAALVATTARQRTPGILGGGEAVRYAFERLGILVDADFFVDLGLQALTKFLELPDALIQLRAYVLHAVDELLAHAHLQRPRPSHCRLPGGRPPQ